MPIPDATVPTWFSSEFAVASDPPPGSRQHRDLPAPQNGILSTGPTDSSCGGNRAAVLSMQSPAQIVNSRTIGASPVLLARGLALGAVVALGLVLLASLPRRRPDPRPAQGARIHTAAPVFYDFLAGVDRGPGGNRGGIPWYRTRTLTLDPSAQEIDAVLADRASVVGRGSRTGRHPSRQHRGCIPGSKRCADADRAGTSR